MATERTAPSVSDYVVTAVGPALITLMVGSLVFFLVEVLYAGQYSSRLMYTMFFFVLATVLVARIAIAVDRGRASMYGIALAIVTYLALLRFVEYPGGWLKSWGWFVNLGLMALVWWSAHKLTWDCTHIDEKEDSSGRGLLSAAGLDADDVVNTNAPGTAAAPSPANSADASPASKKRKKKKPRKGKHDSRLWDWIERYQAHREAERKKGHTPGVWVIYFALAALPLFAIGQSLVDPDDAERRRTTFLMMGVYIAAALGLLVTTSLLGVRRYLRHRKAKVPWTMTASWLGLGGVLIVVFIALGAFLPRPHAEVPWFGISRAGTSDRSASKYAQFGDSPGKGEGRGGNKTKAGDGSASGKGGKPGGGSKGEKGSGGKGKDGKGGSGKKGERSSGDQKGDGDKGGNESPSKSKDKDKDSGRDENDDKGDDAKEDDAKDDDSSKDGNKKSEGSRQTSGFWDRAAGAVKWLVYAIIALLVLFGLFFGVLKYLAPFTDWARRWLEGIRAWWANLFGRSGRTQSQLAKDAQPAAPVRPRPFTAFSNPFADGSAANRHPSDLITYTFDAFDAWSWDRDAGREPAETALEFSHRIGEAFPDHAAAFHRLASLYARLAYSTRPLPENTLEILELAWEQMVHGAPVGA